MADEGLVYRTSIQVLLPNKIFQCLRFLRNSFVFIIFVLGRLYSICKFKKPLEYTFKVVFLYIVIIVWYILIILKK